MKLAEAIRKAKHVYIIGNGGSYANAVHIANDLLACGVKAYTLDPASLTASANDHGFETVFSRWIATVGEPGDLLIALSGSGNSPNILGALDEAKRKGMNTWALVGGGKAASLADCVTITGERGFDMQICEETQVKIGHDARSWLLKNS